MPQNPVRIEIHLFPLTGHADELEGAARLDGFRVRDRVATAVVADLWPEGDNTALTDVPSQFRGLRDQQKEAIDKEYHARTAAIIAGQTCDDQSTPLMALVSLYSAARHGDEDQLIGLIGNPELKEDAIEYTDDALEHMIQGSATYEFLSTPSYPKAAKDGDQHAIKLCRKGSLLHEATAQMVFQKGKWYLWNYEVAWTSEEK